MLIDWVHVMQGHCGGVWAWVGRGHECLTGAGFTQLQGRYHGEGLGRVPVCAWLRLGSLAEGMHDTCLHSDACLHRDNCLETALCLHNNGAGRTCQGACEPLCACWVLQSCGQRGSMLDLGQVD